MNLSNKLIWSGLILVGLSACENRDVNHADGPNFSEIHEDIQYHFDQVEIEGHEYYILERDRNNPHEGFGFMAMKANKTMANQDSIKAYLKTLIDIQVELLAKENEISVEEAESSVNSLFQFHLRNSKSLRDNKPIKKGS
ncbi:hypothetical protein SAMN04488029_0243 [Reichenbachiella faecimaris]|uniref:Uncharacterized protein n=1 Tax=Reichenbachiella faecimaris TaxID=692418 RepID=A0A1W2G5F9_REIFA|nr:hypothetical protein [Reichenbachiella faecimaris]SMD31905.1 hypothetical protein SAMN04488029_0243 [Reichenbachiella faecimaris]